MINRWTEDISDVNIGEVFHSLLNNDVDEFMLAMHRGTVNWICGLV